MNHYSTEEWIDFVNGAASEVRHQEMQKHLDCGCKRCNKTVTFWRNVQSTASQENSFQPPADTVRLVKAAFADAGFEPKSGLKEIVAKVLFDSFRQPAVAGARSAEPQSRQMLFSANPFQIDVKIEGKPDESLLFVTGQLMDLSKPDSIGRGIPITLSNRRGHTVQTVTNNFGEFYGELENRGDLELTFVGPGEKPVIVSLTDALDFVPGMRGADPSKRAN